jgi:hypothetical protein
MNECYTFAYPATSLIILHAYLLCCLPSLKFYRWCTMRSPRHSVHQSRGRSIQTSHPGGSAPYLLGELYADLL